MMKRGSSAITEDELDVVKELVDESHLNGSFENRGGRRNTHYNDMLKSLASGLACNFSDLSSIDAQPGNLHNRRGSLDEQFRFEPATGVECANAIPVVVDLLYSLADKVIDDDIKQEVQAKDRAVKLSISTAFVTVFNN